MNKQITESCSHDLTGIKHKIKQKSNRKTDSETQRKSAGETRGQIPHNALGLTHRDPLFFSDVIIQSLFR